jgi:hypothetical protein
MRITPPPGSTGEVRFGWADASRVDVVMNGSLRRQPSLPRAVLVDGKVAGGDLLPGTCFSGTLPCAFGDFGGNGVDPLAKMAAFSAPLATGWTLLLPSGTGADATFFFSASFLLGGCFLLFASASSPSYSESDVSSADPVMDCIQKRQGGAE